MGRRFVTIWFRHLKTDWFIRRQPALATVPFVLAAPDHGRMVVTAANIAAQNKGVYPGMVVADARALVGAIEVLDDIPGLPEKILHAMAAWFIRYTPVASTDLPDGLILDATGCAHLWGGEEKYLADIVSRLNRLGYTVSATMSDTIGSAWAVTRYLTTHAVIKSGEHIKALLTLPAAALRIDAATAERLEKLGLRQVQHFINIPRTALRRRFGTQLLQRLQQAMGNEEEFIIPVQPPEEYHERLPCLEPIVTGKGIEIGLQHLVNALCPRLQQEGKGLRTANFKCYRSDGRLENISIGTNRATNNKTHIFKLFEFKLPGIAPGPGIELFVLDAVKVEEVNPAQEKLWEQTGGMDDTHLVELLDRISGKMGPGHIHRYLPDEHYWPERSFKEADDVTGAIETSWKLTRPRPVQLLKFPEPIEVTAPIPDYPPMMFRHKGVLHKIVNADGPERIEQEWWLQEGQHRDYYCVEDEAGCRYWIFRSGHYDAARSYRWFIHGFFA